MSLFTKVELSTIDLCSNAVQVLINMGLFVEAEKEQLVIDRILKNAVSPEFLKVQSI